MLTPRAEAPPPAGTLRRGWERSALVLLLLATAVLYLWHVSANGDANAFYAAAVQAGTRNWTAFLFGSLDPQNLLTVDKPPASLWVMALSGRIFGFSPWSLLVPQALMAVAAVALLWAAVRRVAGPAAGLVAGAALALTPVAALMFRFDNPDALLTLLLVAAAYATTRALPRARTAWLAGAGLLVGLAFLTKELQAFLVLPGLALAYLWAAPARVGKRVLQLVCAGAGVVVGAGWWIALVALWPAGDRPYLAGSADNSELGRALGYNGFSRILGRGGGGPVPAGRGFAGFPGGGGQAGVARLFGPEIAGQVSWLLPAALVLLVGGLWLTRRAPRTDLVRAGLVLWGGWTVGAALVLSLMQGTFHSYYTLVVAPGIAALVGIGGAVAWRVRHTLLGRSLLGGTVAVTAVWAAVLLGRTPAFVPWLRWTVLAVGLAAAVLLALQPRRRTVLGAAVAAAVLAGLAGPAAYALDTVVTRHAGGGVSAGPPMATADGRRFAALLDEADASGGASLFAAAMRGDLAPDPQLVALLSGAGTRWSAATTGSSAAAALELATGTPVMAIGGFTGSDPVPTLGQFQADVAAGQVRYYVTLGDGPVRGAGGRPAGAFAMGRTRGGVGAQIDQWVRAGFAPSTVGPVTVYDLSAPRG